MALFSPQVFFMYLLVFLPIVYCPGPMTMLCMSNGISVGPVKSLPSLFGGSTAYVVQLSLVLFSMSLFQEHPVLMGLIRYSGSAYLAFMGLNYFFRKTTLLNLSERVSAISQRKMFFSGFTVAISNPKALLVFTSVFPRFIDQNLPYIRQYLTISAIFLTLQFTSALSYTVMGEAFFRAVQRRNQEALSCKVVGVMLLAVALAVALPR